LQQQPWLEDHTMTPRPRLLWLFALCALLMTLATPLHAAVSEGERIHQETVDKSTVTPTSITLWVDSNTGKDGWDGADPRHPLATLGRALTLAGNDSDDDYTIMLQPGGSETLTSTLTVDEARIKIICPVADPEQGYTLTGVGADLDLLTLSANGIHVEGLQFVATGADADEAGIQVSDGYDNITIVNCNFHAGASTGTNSWEGIEVLGENEELVIERCKFLECHRGVKLTPASSKNPIHVLVKACRFQAGLATAYGIDIGTGAGEVRNSLVIGCHFIEADEDGSTATDAWDGTDGTNGASGPLTVGANGKALTIADCTAYGARDVSFENQAKVNGSATAALINNATHSDLITAAKIAADAIGASEIADDAIDAAAIKDAAIDAATFAADAITAAKVADDAVSEEHVDDDATTQLTKGIVVTKASASLPQSTASAIFNVTGGKVLITSIVGEVTTQIQNQANDTKLVANPSTGTSVDMCAVLDIADDEVGALYSITGTVGDALAGGSAGTVADMTTALVVNTGSIDLNCAASNTGEIKWVLTYIPLDSGAAVATP
jgi:hypothetical protein